MSDRVITCEQWCTAEIGHEPTSMEVSFMASYLECRSVLIDAGEISNLSKGINLMNIPTNTFDPKLDLTFDRIVDVPKALIWKAWTQPQQLMPWFCPLPWKTIACDIDLRPGGLFRTVMQSPEGQTFPNDGCYLEVIENERLTWTNALLPGFRPVVGIANPVSTVGFKFTATIQLESLDNKTRFTAIAQHADEAGCKQHAAMGFEQGWGIALDQLIAYVKKL